MKEIEITFNTLFDMAIWINTYITDPAYQEQLMFKGIQHNRVNGIYKIYV